MEIISHSATQGDPRILIISTYKTRCGMASHTEVLLSHLSRTYAIDVFPMDQYLFRNKDGRVTKVVDAAVNTLCSKLSQYDAVVLQWEPGFWGETARQILRRVKTFTRAVPRLVLVMHTVLPEPALLNVGAIASVVASAGLPAAISYGKQALTGFNSRLYRLLLGVDARGALTVITHTPRDRRFFESVIGFSDVRDHPLCHIHEEWFSTLAADTKKARERFCRLYGEGSVFVAAPGFLVEHKGVETTLHAMRLLPENYKLLIFGGLHPNSIREFERIDPYVRTLMNLTEGYPEEAAARALGEKSASRAGKSGAIGEPPGEPPKNPGKMQSPLYDRVFFMGAPDDYEFAVCMAACDIAVLPYLEVGQSASGPASQIVEIGTRFISTNAQPFVELNKYFPGRFGMFDIGNHVQLAAAIRRALSNPSPAAFSTELNSRTQRDFYVKAINDTASKGRAGVRGAAASRVLAQGVDKHATPEPAVRQAADSRRA